MRKTLQTTVVLEIIKQAGHITNAAILDRIRVEFPDLSATTIHRITKRLVEERIIGMTRSPLDGSAMLDANPQPHFHFACEPCGKVEDISLPLETVHQIQNAVGTAIVEDTLLISGIKHNCPNYLG